MIVTFDFPPIVLQHYHKRVTTSCSAYRKYWYGKWLDGTNFSPCRIGGQHTYYFHSHLRLGMDLPFTRGAGMLPRFRSWDKLHFSSRSRCDTYCKYLWWTIVQIFWLQVSIYFILWFLKHIWLCFDRKVTLSAWSEAARHRDLSDLEIILDSTRRLKELNFPNVCGLNRVLGVEHLKHFMFFLNFLILLWYQTICRKVLVGNQKYWWWLCVYGSCISIP